MEDQHPAPVGISKDERNGYALALREEDRPNPRKRKLDEPLLVNALVALDNVDIAGQLPPQRLLLKLVDYFCTSFHHWIPYLHKKRLRESVCNRPSGPRSELVLHALVAATLRHMEPEDVFMDRDEILEQTRVSRFIVETLALRTMSLESLRALIMLVFDHVSITSYGPMSNR